MTTPVSRRQLLAAAGVGLGLATAGCAGSSGERTATAFMQQSEEAQAELQQENRRLRQELQSGNITRQEAGQQLSALQTELNDQLMEDARTEAQSRNLSIIDSIAPQGSPPLLLLSGAPNALLDFVELDIVVGLGSADRFNEIQQQQQSQANQTVSSGT